MFEGELLVKMMVYIHVLAYLPCEWSQNNEIQVFVTYSLLTVSICNETATNQARFFICYPKYFIVLSIKDSVGWDWDWDERYVRDSFLSKRILAKHTVKQPIECQNVKNHTVSFKHLQHASKSSAVQFSGPVVFNIEVETAVKGKKVGVHLK